MGDMKMLAQRIKDEEGLSLKTYKINGIWHVGYGHNIEANPIYIGYGQFKTELKPPYDITKDQADSIFNIDFGVAQQDAKLFLGDEVFKRLSQTRYGVIAEMAYIMGFTRLRKFGQLKACLVAGDDHAAVNEIVDSLFFKQLPKRVERMVEIWINDAV